MLRRLVKTMLLFTTYVLLGAIVGAIALYAYQIGQWPKLEVWHLAPLEAEFSADQADAVRSLEDYRQLEDRLYAELETEVYQRVPKDQQLRLNRYAKGSEQDPTSYPVDWNRTFELTVDHPVGSVLLLHGLSDSPYSMRTLAEFLHRHGYWVVGLRLPGHGTAPSGLAHVHWQDFSAATRMAAKDLVGRVGKNLPFYMVGYSNGAALAVDYSLAVLEGADQPPAAGLILLSPAIEVSPVAVLAHWQGRLAQITGLEKLGWTSVLPEFDPYKYNSFAVNAGVQIYDLTTTFPKRMDRLAAEGELLHFPHVLAFQSVVDATVIPTGIINGLLKRLMPNGHELVLFDINRHAEVAAFVKADTAALSEQLLDDASLPFDLTVVSNRSPRTDEVVARRKPALSKAVRTEMLDLAWPHGVYSLSHLALPFPPDDPVDGGRGKPGDRVVTLGSTEVHGETGVLVVPASFLLRLRYNPFFDYLRDRIRKTLAQLDPNSGTAR